MATVLQGPVTEVEPVTPTRDYLLASIERLGGVAAFTIPTEELLPLQIKAAQELFALRRKQIAVLDRRATETGIDRITTLEDMVPLLFSHTTYKSYPMSFVTQGKWDKLLRWFSTLSAVPVDHVDLTAVEDFDGFIAALWAAGLCATVTNGTTGKVSLLNRTPLDNARYVEFYRNTTCWPSPIAPDNSRHVFKFMPNGGPYMMMVATAAQEAHFARPDSIHPLSEEPLNVASVVQTALMRTRMAEGSATPEEIAAWDAQARVRAEKVQARARAMVDMLLDLRHEPMMIGGPWLQMWNLMGRARERGIGDGEFHPDTVLSCGGGLKGANLPADYREQILQFLGPVRVNGGYSMSEMSFNLPMCEAGNYHSNPWIIPLMLDRAGEALLPHEGVVEGRFAFLDLGFEGRWGGMITGDKVTMDFTQKCTCGRKGAVVHTDITRFSDLGEDDKIGCAGTVDGYVRGAMGE